MFEKIPLAGVSSQEWLRLRWGAAGKLSRHADSRFRMYGDSLLAPVR